MWLCPSDNVRRVLEIIRTHIYHDTMKGTLTALPLRNKLGKIGVLPSASLLGSLIIMAPENLLVS